MSEPENAAERRVATLERALRAALGLLDCGMYKRALALAIANGFVATDEEMNEIKETWEVIAPAFAPTTEGI